MQSVLPPDTKAPQSATPLPPPAGHLQITGPGEYVADGLTVDGQLVLADLTLWVQGPITVRPGASLALERVSLVVRDPDGAPNGTSSLACEGPAHLSVRDCQLAVVGAAHPMWWWTGTVEIRGFLTHNAELHLRNATAQIDQFRIFELDLSENTRVDATRVQAVFLSTHTDPNGELLQLRHLPANAPFTRELRLGGASTAKWRDSSAEIILPYVHGSSRLEMEGVERAQIALNPSGREVTYHLPRGRLGTRSQPFAVGSEVALTDVGVDSWDVYVVGGPETRVLLRDSWVDEMCVAGAASADVADSMLYADWLGLVDNSRTQVRASTVGALSLASERPDLATSQVRVSGRAWARFEDVRFDCGLAADGEATVEIVHPRSEPSYVRTSGAARVTRTP